MGLAAWIKRWFLRQPKLLDELPEVMGHVTDEQGKQHELHRGPIQHESLSPDQLRRIARLRDVLIDVYPMTLDGWVDGFMRDAFPESEIQIFEACAVVYQHLASQTSLSLEEKKQLFVVLVGISSGAVGSQLASGLPAGKGLPDFESIVAMFIEARQAGSKP